MRVFNNTYTQNNNLSTHQQIPKLLADLLKANNKQIVKLIQQKLKALSLKYSKDQKYKDPGFIFHQNRASNICLVAHWDTVTRPKSIDLNFKNGRITNRAGVLGADDRAGVYAVLQLAKRALQENLPVPNILFTNYEEIGAVGAKEFTERYKPKSQDHIDLFIEIDRKGLNDYVFYNEISEYDRDLQTLLEDNHFVQNEGSFSDVAVLSDHFNKPSVNLSTGYFNEHSKHEYLVLDYLELNIDRVFNIINTGYEHLSEPFFEDDDIFWGLDEGGKIDYSYTHDKADPFSGPEEWFGDNLRL